jgi:hypothetical protein
MEHLSSGLLFFLVALLVLLESDRKLLTQSKHLDYDGTVLLDGRKTEIQTRSGYISPHLQFTVCLPYNKIKDTRRQTSHSFQC